MKITTDTLYILVQRVFKMDPSQIFTILADHSMPYNIMGIKKSFPMQSGFLWEIEVSINSYLLYLFKGYYALGARETRALKMLYTKFVINCLKTHFL